MTEQTIRENAVTGSSPFLRALVRHFLADAPMRDTPWPIHIAQGGGMPSADRLDGTG